jgi:hypothetical protein
MRGGRHRASGRLGRRFFCIIDQMRTFDVENFDTPPFKVVHRALLEIAAHPPALGCRALQLRQAVAQVYDLVGVVVNAAAAGCARRGPVLRDIDLLDVPILHQATRPGVRCLGTNIQLQLRPWNVAGRGNGRKPTHQPPVIRSAALPTYALLSAGAFSESRILSRNSERSTEGRGGHSLKDPCLLPRCSRLFASWASQPGCGMPAALMSKQSIGPDCSRRHSCPTTASPHGPACAIDVNLLRKETL